MIDKEKGRRLLAKKIELVRKLEKTEDQVETNVRQSKPRLLFMAELADVNEQLKRC